jgi:hypothetical protein
MNKRVDSEILSATENTELQSAIEKPADLITAPDALLTQPASKERKLAKGKRKGEAKEEAEEASAEGEQAEGGSAGGASEASDDNTGEMLAQAPKPTPATGASAPKPAAGAEGAAAEGAAAGEAGAGAGSMAPAAAGAAAAAGVGLAAAGGGGGAAAAGGIVVVASSTTFGGSVADGYISGASIYIDANNNGIAEASENTGVVTDAQGNFSLPNPPTAPIIAIGGTNIDTGLPNELILKAPAGSTIINPLTTLLQEYIEGTGSSLAVAQADIKEAFGLPDVDLTTYDPLEQGATDPTALDAQKAAAQIAALLTLAEEAVPGSAGMLVDNLVQMIEEAADTDTPIDLKDGATLEAIADGAGLDPEVIVDAVNLNNAIENATTLAVDGPGSLSDIQQAGLDGIDGAPVFQSGLTGSVLENGCGEIVYTANAVDLEGSAVTYELLDSAGGLFEMTPDGNVYAMTGFDFEAQSSYQIQVAASDEFGHSVTQTVTIAIGNANEAPYYDTPDTYITVAENSPNAVVFDAAPLAHDPDGTPLMYSLEGEYADQFTVDASGVVRLVNGDFEGGANPLSVTVVASDGENSAGHNVIVTLTNVNEAPVLDFPDSATIAENSSSGSTVFEADAYDPDGGSLTYSLADSAGGLFTIDTFSGTVRTTESFDFETDETSYQIAISVTDGTGLTSTDTVAIQVGDLNEAPEFDEYSASVGINENFEGALYTAHAVDPEGGAVSYWMETTHEGRFSIDSATGVVSVNDGFNFETDNTEWSLFVGASDTDFNTVSGVNLSVSVGDVDEVPFFYEEDTQVSVFGENQPVGSLIWAGEIGNNDYYADDPLTFSLVDGGDIEHFQVDASSGYITLVSPLDAEADDLLTFQLQVTDSSGNGDTLDFSYTVENESVEWTSPPSVGLMENLEVGTEVYNASVSFDGGASEDVTWSLFSGEENFSIDSVTGVVTADVSFDRESGSHHFFEVRATYESGFTTRQVMVDIGDENEYAPSINPESTAWVQESDTVGTTFHMVEGHYDQDPETDFTYSIFGGSGAEYVSLQEVNNQAFLLVNQPFDAEACDLTVTIGLSDGDPEHATVYQTITINVENDVDDTAPMAFGEYTISEGSTVGDFAAWTEVSDPEGGPYSFSLADDVDGLFAINATSGEITLAQNGVLDYEAVGETPYELEVLVIDAGGNEGGGTVLVHVGNVNDNAPTVTSGDVTIAEGNGGWNMVHTVEAYDADIHTFGDTYADSLSFSINPTVGDAGAFEINSASGELTLYPTTDYMQQREYHIQVLVQDRDGVHWDTQDLTLHVAPVAEEMDTLTSGDPEPSWIHASQFDMRFNENADYIRIAEGMQVGRASNTDSITVDGEAFGGEVDSEYVVSITEGGLIQVTGDDVAGVFNSENEWGTLADQLLDEGSLGIFHFGGDSYIVADFDDGEETGDMLAADIIADADVTAIEINPESSTSLWLQNDVELVATMPSGTGGEFVADASAFDFYSAEGADYLQVAEGSTVAGVTSAFIESLDGFTVETGFWAYIDCNGMMNLGESESEGNLFIDAVIGFDPEPEDYDRGLDALIAIADQMLDQGEIVGFQYGDIDSSFVVTDTDGVNDQFLAAIQLEGFYMGGIGLSPNDPTHLWLEQGAV